MWNSVLLRLTGASLIELLFNYTYPYSHSEEVSRLSVFREVRSLISFLNSQLEQSPMEGHSIKWGQKSKTYMYIWKRYCCFPPKNLPVTSFHMGILLAAFPHVSTRSWPWRKIPPVWIERVRGTVTVTLTTELETVKFANFAWVSRHF